MAESLKKKLLEGDKSVDLVVGPGRYAYPSTRYKDSHLVYGVNVYV